VADLVFTTPSGQPIHADKLATKFKAILQKADLPMMRLYDLRHTTATTRPGGWRSAKGGV
jgi:integrase